MALNTYISIGNSNDRLSQREWASFIADVKQLIELRSDAGILQIHGTWYSGPDQPQQNANWCVEILPPTWYAKTEPTASLVSSHIAARERRRQLDMHERRIALQEELATLCRRYRQDTFAWATAEVELVKTGWPEIEIGTDIPMRTDTERDHPYLDARMRETLAMNRRDAKDAAMDQMIREGWATPEGELIPGTARDSDRSQPASTGDAPDQLPLLDDFSTGGQA